MASNNEEYQHIFYQLHTPGQALPDVAVIQRRLNDKSLSILANLVDAIRKEEQLQCRPRDLRIYARGTTMENYQNEQHLEIDTSLNDEGIQGTSRASPILVVISAPTPLLPAANDASVLVNDEVSTQTMQLRNLASRILKILTFLIVHVYIFS